MKTLQYIISLLLLLTLATAYAAPVPPISSNSIGNILMEIEKLEGKNDPKCYATASRLEDFMFGTPLTFSARNTKNNLQKELVLKLWSLSSNYAAAAGYEEVGPAQVNRALSPLFAFSLEKDGHWDVKFPTGGQIRINGTDKRQYSSIAYSLRAVLAVQQESLLTGEVSLLPLEQESIGLIKDAVDLYTLSVLKVADQMARADNRHELDSGAVAGTWHQLLQIQSSASDDSAQKSAAQEAVDPGEAKEFSDLALTHAVIEQKVRSYAQYNQISNQLFVRNLQVYFAKQRWPASKEEGRDFRNLFTESLILLADDLYKGSETIALERGAAVIQEQDVVAYLQRFLPYQVNAYEDVIFFPALARSEQIVVESYDMDAFRDSGIHWRYLQFALQTEGFQAYLEPDPFALELITENIAHLGVLLLRLTGAVGTSQGRDRIATSDLAEAMGILREKVAANNQVKPRGGSTADTLLSSSESAQAVHNGSMFTDTTEQSGIEFMHRSSDWLNRLLRSYLQKDENTGIITIPPAFGGAGVAVGDINDDGHVDVLLLSGRGNSLYLNDGAGRFEDITGSAGLAWVRPEDNNPGEPRQPLIADLNNDGHQDIVITYVNDLHRVYKNNGDLTFTDVTNISGLGGKDLVGGPATVFDFNNDGLLDIYVTYFGNYIHGVLPTLERRNTNGLPNRLFKNAGDFRFVDVTQKSGLGNTGWAQAVTHTDIDGDSLQDVIAGNDFGVNAYYRNLGGGVFTDIAASLGTDKPSYTMGIGIADLNDDLLPDFYISNIVTMNKDQKYVLPSADTTMAFNPDKLANMRVVEANDLFLSQNNEEGLAYSLSQAVERGYSSTGWSWGAEFFDSDNDGDDDLYVLNGMNEFNLYSSENPYYTDPLENKKKDIYIPVSTRESNVFFLNDGGRLNNVSKASGLDLLGNSRSAAYLDFDNDGDLDIVLNNYHEAARFYRNDSPSRTNGWLKVKLIGDPAKGVNRDAIGARLLVRDGSGHIAWREIRGSSGYMAVQPKEQHFGLADREKVNLEVIWPNGFRQSFAAVAARQSIVITYGAESPVRRPPN